MLCPLCREHFLGTCTLMTFIGTRDKREQRRQTDIMPQNASHASSIAPRSPVVPHRTVAALRKSFTPRLAHDRSPTSKDLASNLASSSSNSSSTNNTGIGLYSRRSLSRTELAASRNRFNLPKYIYWILSTI